ncbi:helix-turn-helix transcriptional regulator [Mycobacterium conspicuum]|uniref:Transcriptional regulator n=1 Tax=Mycobacterium conspicuum TaxID=44010 RepID=A0A1X1TMP6_9MYCO|nr:helix-turn-helix domain-containing protein [Mycobacterium conspicuum]ORV45820.1 transcriptional regulator [Mycobacterium conspicuum]BBZ38937.1 transcriptional regulator [Mycobacterium conspicuum]
MSEIIPIGESAGRRREVLRFLRATAKPTSILAIADALGVHPNTVRFHLDVLVGNGQVEQVAPDRKGPGRPPLMFQAVRQMDRGGTRHYRMLAEILSTALAAERNSEMKALAAGRAWGMRMESPSDGDTGAEEAVDRLFDMLDELGFAPERRAANGDAQIGLRHCPFLELAETRTEVVCPIHLGLMQGAMETWGADVTVDRLEAFVEPDLCVARLRAPGAAEETAR